MSIRNSHLDDLVAALDPHPERTHAPTDRRALADLAGILNNQAPVTEPAPRRSRVPVRRPWFLALPVAAALALLMVLIWPSGGPGGTGPALAATPTPLSYQPLPVGSDPRALLDQIAQLTLSLPDDTGTGRYAHLTSRGWNLWTSVDGKRVTSQVVPVRTESWISADGAGRTITTIEAPGRRAEPKDERFGPGELAGSQALRSLSSDDLLLAQQLALGHPAQNGPAERLVAIKDTYNQVPVPPAVRAAIVRYLAATPTLTATGTVTDRAGRTGLAFSVDSDYSGLPTRYTLIVDPSNGQLLASEDTLTTSAGALHVPVPSVISYTTHLSATYTDRTD